MNRNVTEITNETETLYTEKEAAEKCRVSTITLYRARKAGKLKFFQVGRRVFVNQQQLNDFFASCEQNAGQN